MNSGAFEDKQELLKKKIKIRKRKKNDVLVDINEDEKPG